jgi:hypothetical protein
MNFPGLDLRSQKFHRVLMRILTNNYQDCELLNLGTNRNGRGPYVLRQDGVPPESLTSQEGRFLLRKDRTWVLNVTVFTLPEKEQEQFIFQNAAELHAVVQDLGGTPVVEDALPPGKSRAELLAAIETTISKVWRQMREARAGKLTLPGMKNL